VQPTGKRNGGRELWAEGQERGKGEKGQGQGGMYGKGRVLGKRDTMKGMRGGNVGKIGAGRENRA